MCAISGGVRLGERCIDSEKHSQTWTAHLLTNPVLLNCPSKSDDIRRCLTINRGSRNRIQPLVLVLEPSEQRPWLTRPNLLCGRQAWALQGLMSPCNLDPAASEPRGNANLLRATPKLSESSLPSYFCFGSSLLGSTQESYPCAESPKPYLATTSFAAATLHLFVASRLALTRLLQVLDASTF